MIGLVIVNETARINWIAKKIDGVWCNYIKILNNVVFVYKNEHTFIKHYSIQENLNKKTWHHIIRSIFEKHKVFIK